jgi:LAO/AO transport system kinase
VVVTKADGDLASAANHAAADLRRALHLLRPKHDGLTVETLLVSSPTGVGIAEVWAEVEAVHAHLAASGALAHLRAHQAKAWMWDELRSGLLERFRASEAARTQLADLEAQVVAGEVSPTAAAQRLLGG